MKIYAIIEDHMNRKYVINTKEKNNGTYREIKKSILSIDEI